MADTKIIERSPVRHLDNILSRGLVAGETGVVSSVTGLGKTSVLVQIGLDYLLQSKKVIHVSFTQTTSYVLTWYEDIFKEFIDNMKAGQSAVPLDELARNRIILNFNQDGVTSDTIRASLRAIIEDGKFDAQAIIIDGFDFSKADIGRIQKLKAFAKETGLCLWYSCTVHDDSAYNDKRIPNVLAPFADELDVVLVLEAQKNHIKLSITKDRDSSPKTIPVLKLDPETLLILEE